jgi:O-antigen/teichoic acid export membrane protein
MIKKFFKSEFFVGSFIPLILLNLFNFLNLIFNFSMGRMLSSADYGIISTLMSFIYLYSIPSEIIQSLAAKYTSKFNQAKENGKIKWLIKKLFLKGSVFATLIFLILLGISIFLSRLFNVKIELIILTNLLIFPAFYGPIFRGVLQGKKEFEKFGISFFIEGVIKLALAIILVYIGFNVFGAMLAVVLSSFFGVILSIYFCKKIIKTREEKFSLSEVKKSPYFVVMIILMIFMSLDVIFAKIFFTPDLTGKYAVISLLGKVFVMGTQGISRALFPISSEKKGNNQSSTDLFNKAILVTLLCCLIGLLVYYLFPEIIIKMLYGEKYLEFSKYLFYSGVAFSFLALTNVVLIYRLAIDQTKNIWWLFLFVALQVILFILLNKTMEFFIAGLVASNIAMFIGSLILTKK